MCVYVWSGEAVGLSPALPSAELALPQKRLDLPSLGLQARGLRGGAAAVGRHDADQSLINVRGVGNVKESQEMRSRSPPPH